MSSVPIQTAKSNILMGALAMQCETLHDMHPEFFDLDELSSKKLIKLVHSDYEKFKSIIDISKLPTSSKLVLFYKNPDRYAKYLDTSSMTGAACSIMLISRPDWQKKYDIPVIKINDPAWISLIKFKGSYVDLFIETLPNMINKTIIRAVIGKFPKIIPRLTVDSASNSVLSPKEWVLLLTHKTLIGAKVSYSSEVKEWIRETLVFTLLNGDVSNTNNLQKGMNILNGVTTL